MSVCECDFTGVKVHSTHQISKKVCGFVTYKYLNVEINSIRLKLRKMTEKSLFNPQLWSSLVA